MWYRRLPEARREELRREWLADQARTFALEASARRQLAQDSLAIAGIFALGDLSAPGGSLATILGVTAAGLLLGAILSMLRSDRLVSATAGLLAFFAYQWWSRDGLSGLHLFVLVLVACACAYVGARREEPGTG